ncbi:MAG: NnrS family protein [Methyloceanibacter sp.]
MAIYGAMIAAALLRVGAGAFPQAYMVLIGTAGAAWTAAFALFLFEYAPMLLGPRVERSAA